MFELIHCWICDVWTSMITRLWMAAFHKLEHLQHAFGSLKWISPCVLWQSNVREKNKGQSLNPSKMLWQPKRESLSAIRILLLKAFRKHPTISELDFTTNSSFNLCCCKIRTVVLHKKKYNLLPTLSQRIIANIGCYRKWYRWMEK